MTPEPTTARMVPARTAEQAQGEISGRPFRICSAEEIPPARIRKQDSDTDIAGSLLLPEKSSEEPEKKPYRAE